MSAADLFANSPGSNALKLVSRGSAGTGPSTAQSPGTFGKGFAYGGVVPETQGEVDRASSLAAQRGQGLLNAGDTNASTTANLANRADASGDFYRQQGAGDYSDQVIDRQSQYGALDRLRSFYNQGPGPSAAEAQMRQGADANMGQAIALAHSGRGAGGNANAMRQAAFSNAAAGQQMNQQLGVLRANEGQAWRQQQLGALGMEQSTLGGMRGQDISSMGTNSQAGLGYGQLGQAYTQTGMSNQLGYGQLGSQQLMEGERLRQQILGQQLGSNVQMRGQDVGFNSATNDNTGNSALWGGVGAVAGGTVGLIAGGPGGAVAGGAAGSAIGKGAAESDIRAKKDIQLADVFGNAPTGPLDAANARQTADTGPRTDLRPAKGAFYDYKDPSAPGAAPGQHYGPMAQDLLKTPAGASTVVQQPNGRLGVDTGRLSLVNASAISEQQNQLDRLRALLDQGQARGAQDVGSRFGGMR